MSNIDVYTTYRQINKTHAVLLKHGVHNIKAVVRNGQIAELKKLLNKDGARCIEMGAEELSTILNIVWENELS